MRPFYDAGDDAIVEGEGSGSGDDEGAGGLETGVWIGEEV